MNLHDWQVDFASWCSYKYMNSGPGNASGCFVNEKHHHNKKLHRFAGWWGHNKDNRFKPQEPLVDGPSAVQAREHLLVGDLDTPGAVMWRQTAGTDDLELGTVTVPDGAAAHLVHPEHGAQGIAPGTYRIRRQREQADQIRMVAD
mgnify:CR=1 FL=1